MGAAYPLTPVEVPEVDTKFRTIKSAIPHPKSVAIMEQLREAEPECMQGQPAILWDRAEGATVYDPFGNKWIDFSSGVLITNAGHGRTQMIEAIVDQAQHGLLTSYCFVNDARAELVAKLKTVAPSDDHKVMLISTGSESCEMVIKLSRAYAASKGKKPSVFVTFANAFHGRTLGSQFAGGIEGLKDWIGYTDDHYVQIPFPDGGTRSTPEQNDFAYFESVHGTAWDIAGKGVANPIASILSAGLMLRWLGEEKKAGYIETAVKELLLDGKILTPDLGGQSSTSNVGNDIVKRVMEMACVSI